MLLLYIKNWRVLCFMLLYLLMIWDLLSVMTFVKIIPLLCYILRNISNLLPSTVTIIWLYTNKWNLLVYSKCIVMVDREKMWNTSWYVITLIKSRRMRWDRRWRNIINVYKVKSGKHQRARLLRGCSIGG